MAVTKIPHVKDNAVIGQDPVGFSDWLCDTEAERPVCDDGCRAFTKDTGKWWKRAAGAWVEMGGGGSGSGEANTASNVGTGAGLFKAKTGADLAFKSLTGGPQVVLTPNADEVSVEIRPTLPVSLGGYALLTNVGTAYDAILPSRGLGFCLIDLLGYYNTCWLTVCVNKLGSGTHSWQLWNDSDGTEVGVITDSVAGIKYLTGVFSNINLTGLKALRIRAKSTVAGDDPHYYGASALFYRTQP